MQRTQKKSGGYLMVVVLVFAGIFLTILTSFVVFIVTQSRLIDQKIAFEQAGQIAESGLDYVKWYLAHYPNATTTALTGVYSDPEGGTIGEYQISIASTTFCGTVAALSVQSVGYTYADPSVRRTVSARYAQPTVAEFSSVLNSNVWVGDDVEIIGPYHTNGGVRMDGTNNSLVSSAQATWSCTPSFGCTSTTTEAGIFTTTSNANTSLFEFPVPTVDFSGITADLATIRNRAQNGGLYFGPSGRQGYHVIFTSDGQVEVRRVNSKQNEPNGYAWGRYMHILNSTTLVSRQTVPASCPVVFFEDQIWLEGTVRGNITLAAGDIDTVGVDPSIILNNNILYGSATSSFLAVAERDVVIGLVVPDDMRLNGIFIAQQGSFGRNHYDTSMPNAWEEYIERNSLQINGTVVSSGRVGTKWVNSSGNFISGFQDRYHTYDRNLTVNPPPFIPIVSDVYQYSDWRDAN